MIAVAGEAGPAQSHLGLRLMLVAGLVLVNAFFVAAEFALVAVRRGRMDELSDAGDTAARAVRTALDHLDRYISATQVGITVASLALGWIGEPAFAELLDRGATALGVRMPAAVAHSTSAVIIAFLVLVFLHLVLGELGPKRVALARAEDVSRLVVRPLRWFAWLAAPAIWIVHGAAGLVARWFGVSTHGARGQSVDELRMLVLQAGRYGTLGESDRAMLSGIFDFHDKKARDVMRPRTDVVALPASATVDDVWALVRAERYSRYPVFDESLDDVTGVFLAKDLWLHEPGRPFALKDHVRPALYVPDNRAAERVLDDLRKRRAHMAVVLDEFGGTAGIITLEDLVEQVIGDINDEYDVAQREAVQSNGVLELTGSLSLVDVRSDYRLEIPEGDWNTLGGYVFGTLGRVARIGDRVPFPGGHLEVVAMDGRRVAAVRVLATRGARESDTPTAPPKPAAARRRGTRAATKQTGGRGVHR